MSINVDRTDDNAERVMEYPFRWLEEKDSPEKNAYIDEQNRLSRSFLEDDVNWQKLNDKLIALWNYPEYGCPIKYGSFYYYFMNTGLQNQSALYQLEDLHAMSKKFFDPNILSKYGTTLLHFVRFSEDGNYMAYGITENDCSWIKICVRNVKLPKDTPECLQWIKDSKPCWTKDNKGFFYVSYITQPNKNDEAVNLHRKLYYHYLGNTQSQDAIMWEFPNQPSWRLFAKITDCGCYLLLTIVEGNCNKMLYYANINGNDFSKHLKLLPIVPQFESSEFQYITNEGELFFFRTNKNAPNFQIISLELSKPAAKNWTILVQENVRDVLQNAYCVHADKLLLLYARNVKSVLEVLSLHSGKHLYTIMLGVGTITALSGTKQNSEIFFHFVSFINPGTVYYYDFANEDRIVKVFRQVELNSSSYDSGNYAITQVWYRSSDNVNVPMFIVRKKKLSKESNPCLLYAYGGFNVNLMPSFSITGIMFLEAFNGTLAFANVRGGGEFGKQWHESGSLLNKQKVFDDLQAAAEFLVSKMYTSVHSLAIQGGYNGGLTVGACIIQRPNLFAAAIIQAGILDMLRWHKFSNGQDWIDEYGSPDDEMHYRNIIKYSPLHNVFTPQDKDEQYPATLLLTAVRDERVDPMHALKFASALQDAVKDCQFQERPILLRVYPKAQRTSGKCISKRIDEATDILMFLYKTLDVNKLNL